MHTQGQQFFNGPSVIVQVGMMMAKVRVGINSEAPTALVFKAPTILALAREIKAAVTQDKPILSSS